MFMLKYNMKYSIYKCCSFIRLFYDTYSISVLKLIQIVKTTHNRKALAPALHTDEI